MCESAFKSIGPLSLSAQVRTYVDPLVNLEQSPAAAQALGAAARRKYKGMNQYMGIGQDSSQK